MIEISKKENEKFERLLRRFNRNIQQSGLLRLVKKKRFYEQEPSRRERRIAAIRKNIIREIRRKRKEGY